MQDYSGRGMQDWADAEGEPTTQHPNRTTESIRTADRIAEGLNAEFIAKLRKTNHHHSADAIVSGLNDVRNGDIQEQDMWDRLYEAHTRDHNGNSTEGDPGFYFGAGGAWDAFKKQEPNTEDIASKIGEHLKAMFGDQVEAIQVTGVEPLFTIDEVAILQAVVMTIAGVYMKSEGGLAALLAGEVSKKAMTTLRSIFTGMGANSPQEAVIDFMVPLEAKLHQLRNDMLDGKTVGAFVAPY